MALGARLNRLERLVVRQAGIRRGLDLEQLILASYGLDPGQPRQVLEHGEPSIAAQVVAVAGRSAQGSP